MMRKMTFIPLVFALALSACTSAQNLPPDITPSGVVTAEPNAALDTSVPDELPDEFYQILKANRAAVFTETDDEAADAAREYLPGGYDAEADNAVADAIRQSAASTAPEPDFLTHAQITQELDYIFDVLQHGYGAYGYFGGDEAFGALRAGMDARLATMPDPMRTADYMGALLVPHLRLLIQDNHFTIFSTSITRRLGVQRNFLDCGMIFYKDGDDYVTTLDGEAYKLADDPARLLRPTIDAAGRLAYMLGGMLDAEMQYANYMVNLTHLQTGETINKRGIAGTASFGYLDSLQQGEFVYKLEDRDGVPVLANRMLSAFDEETQAQLDSFAVTGVQMSAAPVSILDLRGHQGGNGSIATQWVQAFTRTFTDISYNSSFFTMANLSATARVIYGQAQGTARISGSSWSDILSIPAPQELPNESLLFVLTDGLSLSAAEMLVGHLRHVENVVFVGTPTMGCLLTGNVGTIWLPESRMGMSFGVNLNVLRDLSDFEGVGFAPDFWVPPGESLERVLLLIERYGLR